MSIIKETVIGDCRLILGDCLEVMPTLGEFDAVVTDPPYGIKADKGFDGFDGFGGFGKPIARKQYSGGWDDSRPQKEVFDCLIKCSTHAIIFGGNYFTDILPVGKHWFVWDKKNTMPTYSDCELVWTNIDRKSVKLLEYEYNGLIGKREKRVHPTQKPVEVMRWCIEKIPNKPNTILDPFMGSGTTGVACVKTGRKFTGIELDPEYYEIACKRIQDAVNRPDLFIQPKEQPKQIQEAMEL